MAVCQVALCAAVEDVAIEWPCKDEKWDGRALPQAGQVTNGRWARRRDEKSHRNTREMML